MTSSIPNSFSSDDLKNLLKTAPSDVGSNDPAKDIEDILQSYCDDLQSQMDKFSREMDIPPQFVGKAVALHTCIRLMGWHSTISSKHMEEREFDDALQWARDAGKIQAIVCILRSIEVCPEDFLFDYE